MKNWIILAGATTLFSLTACGAISGPSDATIEELARKGMAETLVSSDADAATKKAYADAVAKASFTKKGMCNNTKPDVYACMVDVSITKPGETSETKQTFVVEATKMADGNWSIAS